MTRRGFTIVLLKESSKSRKIIPMRNANNLQTKVTSGAVSPLYFIGLGNKNSCYFSCQRNYYIQLEIIEIETWKEPYIRAALEFMTHSGTL